MKSSRCGGWTGNSKTGSSLILQGFSNFLCLKCVIKPFTCILISISILMYYQSPDVLSPNVHTLFFALFHYLTKCTTAFFRHRYQLWFPSGQKVHSSWHSTTRMKFRIVLVLFASFLCVSKAINKPYVETYWESWIPSVKERITKQ